MSHYRKIDVRIWNDEKFNSLSPDGKLAFFMVLTHPMMTSLGAMRGSPEGLAAEARMEVEPFKEAFAELLAERLVEHDPNGPLIALPYFLKYNPPANPNAVKSWAKAIEFLPECDLFWLVIQRAKQFTQGFKEPLPEPFLEPESREQRAESRETQAYTKPRARHNRTSSTQDRVRLAVVNGGMPVGEDEL